MALGVNAQNFRLHRLARMHSLQRFGYGDVGQFADVNQALDAGLNLRKSAKFHQARDDHINRLADLVARFHSLPRVGHHPLAAEGNALVLRIEADDLHLDHLPNLKRLARVANWRPANFADMEETVGPAQVHKRAEGAQAAHFAVDDITHMQSAEEFFLASGAVFALGQHLRHDKAAALLIHLNHLEAHRLANPLLKLGLTLLLRNIAGHIHNVRGGHEAAQPVELHRQPALVVAHNLVVGCLAVVKQILRQQPIPLLQRIGNAQLEDAVVINLLADDYINLVPYLQPLDKLRIELVQVRLRNHTVALAADVDNEFRGVNFNNCARAQLAAVRLLHGLIFVQKLLKEFQVRRLLLRFSMLAHLPASLPV